MCIRDSNYIAFEKNGCKIFVDSNSFSFLKGSLIDYVDDGLNQGIKFVNPNAKAICGCGEVSLFKLWQKLKYGLMRKFVLMVLK